MKNSFLFNCRTTLKNTPVMRFVWIVLLVVLSTMLQGLYAQDAKLSVQGILKKATGEAVPDGTYSLTFRLYDNVNDPINQNIWEEMQNSVDVVSGIYSTVLGNTEPLDVEFDTDYFLGVTVGSTEMTPRIQLTSAPYALSIRGENNKFPSSGQVVADSIDVNGNVLTRMGAPGLNGVNKNGYGFLGDKDSGLFTTSANQVSLFVNNAEEVRVTRDSLVINGEARPENVRLDAQGKISYNGLNDWRLVETDYFESGIESWKIYDTWNDQTGVDVSSVTTFVDDFAVKALVSNPTDVLKKKFTLPGSSVGGTYTYVKVKFTYYFLDSWDLVAEEQGWAAFSKTENCSSFSIGWFSDKAVASWGTPGPPFTFANAANFYGATDYSDSWVQEEMISRYPSGGGNTDFWLVFGANNLDDENFGIGMIEIWVK